MPTTGPNVHRGVLQTRFGAPEGNCYAACMATVLGLTLDQVPDFRWPAGVPWYGLHDNPSEQQQEASRAVARQWREWLEAQHGLTLVRLEWDISADPSYAQVFTIGTVTSPRALPHAVVCRGGKPVWDPHPEQDSYGIACTDHELFVVARPAMMLAARHEGVLAFCQDADRVLGLPWRRLMDELDAEYARRLRDGGALGG